MQRVLGDDWHQLPEVIQRHYQLDNKLQTQSVVTGIMQIRYPLVIKPVLFIARLLGALIDLHGSNMQVSVRKWVTQYSEILHWKRTIKAPDGRTIIFASRMEYQQDNELIEYVGFGFGIRLQLSVEDGRLVYRSVGHLCKTPWITIPIPDVLFLGHAVIIETALSDTEFELDFTIRHPLWGETYYYGGVFSYPQTNDGNSTGQVGDE
jgi:hypothetical protein